MTPIPATRGRILCTEDDADSRVLLVYLLEAAGYLVTGTGNSADALSLTRSERFDLLLLDHWMPGLSGSQLTREIRKFDKSTPILFYSGAAYESDKQEALDAGAQGYLVKPSDISELVHQVGKLIAEARIAFPGAVDLP